jgi:hypothetical protein
MVIGISNGAPIPGPLAQLLQGWVLVLVDAGVDQEIACNVVFDITSTLITYINNGLESVECGS